MLSLWALHGEWDESESVQFLCAAPDKTSPTDRFMSKRPYLPPITVSSGEVDEGEENRR